MPDATMEQLTPEEYATYRASGEIVGRAALALLRAARAVRVTEGGEPEVVALMKGRAETLFGAMREVLSGVSKEDYYAEDFWRPAEALSLVVLACDIDPATQLRGEPAWEWVTSEAAALSKIVLGWAYEHGVEWADPDGCTVEAPADA